MKRYLILMLMVVAIVGCEKEYVYEYVIENETGFDVTIEGYDRIDIQGLMIDNFLENAEFITVSPHSNYSVIKEMGFHAEPVGVFNTTDIDSVNIIFNDKKIIKQFCDKATLRSCEIERNIMGYETSSYIRTRIGRSSGEKEYRFTYTITEQDYNNAIPIE